MFLGLSSHPRFALAGDHHVADSEALEGIVDPLLPVATVCGDVRGGRPVRSLIRSPAELELGRVGGIARLDVVVENHSVLVVGDLVLVAELDRLAEPALGDRTGVRIVQADPPGGAVGGQPRQPLPGLGSDLSGRLEQLVQVIDGPGCQPTATAPRRRVGLTVHALGFGLGPGPPQRPLGVGHQPLGVADRGLGQVGELAGGPPDRGQRLVTARRAAAAQLEPDLVGAPAYGRDRFRTWVRTAPPAAWMRRVVAAICPIAFASGPESVG